MKLKLTRRQFGQLAIASTIVTAFTYFTDRTFAQVSNQVIGVNLGPVVDPDHTAIPEIDSTDGSNYDENTIETITNQEIVLQSLDLESGKVQNLSTPRVLVTSYESLSAFTSLSDGTPVIVLTPVSTSQYGNRSTRLVFLSMPEKTVTLAGLKKQNTLTSLLGTDDGKLLGLVTKKDGRPPVELGEVNIQTGEISFFDKINLPQDRQISNLVKCQEGKVYVTAVQNNGTTELVELDLETGKTSVQAQLNINNKKWNNGLQSLVCSPSGQLLAFGSLRYATPNKVHTLDPNTGTLSLLKSFNAIRIITPRA
jgi:hypothetical protein